MFASIVITKWELPCLHLALFILVSWHWIQRGRVARFVSQCHCTWFIIPSHLWMPLERLVAGNKMYKEEKNNSMPLFSYHRFSKENEGRVRNSNKQLHGIDEAGEKPSFLIKLQISIVLTPKLILEVINTYWGKCFIYSFTFRWSSKRSFRPTRWNATNCWRWSERMRKISRTWW